MQPTEISRLPGMSLIRVTGRDRVSFLHNFCTNDLMKLQPGDGCEAFVTDAKGRILDHVVVLMRSDELLVLSLAPEAPRLIQHWERYCITEEVQFTDLSSTSAGLVLCGPQATEAVSSCGVPPPTGPWSHTDASAPPLGIVVVRFPFPEESAYLLITSSDEEAAVRERLCHAGGEVGSGAQFEELRIDHRLPIYRRDISEENLPQEVDRNDLAISFTKGCYLGQETVARIDALGHVNRLLVGLRWSSATPPPDGTELYAQGTERPVGTIGFAIGSADRNEGLALAMVRREYAVPGTVLRGTGGTAEVR